MRGCLQASWFSIWHLTEELTRNIEPCPTPGLLTQKLHQEDAQVFHSRVKVREGMARYSKIAGLSTPFLTKPTKQALLKESIFHLGFLKEQPKSNVSISRVRAEAFTLLSFKEGVVG